MIRLFAFAGKFALFLAVMALLTGVSLFIVGAFVASWPILRVSPRDRRMQSLVGLAVAVMGAVRAYGLDKPRTPEAATEDTEDTDVDIDVPEGWTVVAPGVFLSADASVLSLRGHHYYPADAADKKEEGVI